MRAFVICRVVRMILSTELVKVSAARANAKRQRICLNSQQQERSFAALLTARESAFWLEISLRLLYSEALSRT